MKSSVNVEWVEKMHFIGRLDGFDMHLDASNEAGGENLGPRPKALMLIALGGCTGIDVVSILKKMQVELAGFNILIEGETAEEHPKKYTSIKMIYEFRGENLPMEKLERAIQLSQEKYCGVMAVYKDVIAIKTEIRLL